MTLGEQLTTIAENVPKVYNSGYEKGKSEGGGVSPFIKDLNYMFYNESRLDIRDAIYALCKDVELCMGTFAESDSLTEFDSKRFPDTSKCITFFGMFANCPWLVKADLSHLDCSSAAEGWFLVGLMGMFENCVRLEEVVGLLYKSSEKPCTEGAFIGCTKLRRLTFAEDCGNYKGTDISIANCNFDRSGMRELFNSLPTITNSSKLTITGNPCLTDPTDPLTAEDRAIATSKGWTLVEA